MPRGGIDMTSHFFRRAAFGVGLLLAAIFLFVFALVRNLRCIDELRWGQVTFSIYEDTSWESAQRIYYSVQHGRTTLHKPCTVAVKKASFAEALSFSLIVSEREGLVALVEGGSPELILALYDSRERSSWPYLSELQATSLASKLALLRKSTGNQNLTLASQVILEQLGRKSESSLQVTNNAATAR